MANFLHESIFHFLYFVSTDAPRDECAIRMHMRSFSEKGLEISFVFEHLLKSRCIVSYEPHDDGIDFIFRASLPFHFRDIEWVDFREWHFENLDVLHNLEKL